MTRRCCSRVSASTCSSARLGCGQTLVRNAGVAGRRFAGVFRWAAFRRAGPAGGRGRTRPGVSVEARAGGLPSRSA